MPSAMVRRRSPSTFDGWSLVGAALLVKGTVVVSGDTVELDLKLFDVEGGEELALNWSPTVVRKSRLRAQVHEFVQRGD